MSGDGYVWIPSLRESRGNWSQMLQSLADLYVRGVAIDWEGFDRDYVSRKVAIPHYPFQRKRFWVDTPTVDEDDSEPLVAAADEVQDTQRTVDLRD